MCKWHQPFTLVPSAFQPLQIGVKVNREFILVDICNGNGKGVNDGQCQSTLKVCLLIQTPSPSQCPSKFNIGILGYALPVDWQVIIDTMLNFDGHSDGDGIGMCKQTITCCQTFPSKWAFDIIAENNTKPC